MGGKLGGKLNRKKQVACSPGRTLESMLTPTGSGEAAEEAQVQQQAAREPVYDDRQAQGRNPHDAEHNPEVVRPRRAPHSRRALPPPARSGRCPSDIILRLRFGDI